MGRPKQPKKFCSVDNCNRTHHSKGFCALHKHRMKVNGEVGPAGLLIADKGELLNWLLTVACKHAKKKNCLIWPYPRGSDGYPIVTYKGKSRRAHRLVCRKVHGKPPTKEHQACHTCGKGHEGCINPHHLYWGTPKENMDDRAAHGNTRRGETHGGAKLTDLKVSKILRLIDKQWPDTKIALKYGVTPRVIRLIRIEESWKHLKRAA